MTYLSDGLYTLQTIIATPTPITVTNRIAYVCKGSSLLTFQLPTTTLAGFKFKIIGNLCNWKVQQNSGQFIVYGAQTTTTGTSGSISSSYISDISEFLCITVNDEWKVMGSNGNLTIT